MLITVNENQYDITIEVYHSGEGFHISTEDHIRVEECATGKYIGSAIISHEYGSIDIVQQIRENDFFETSFPYTEYEDVPQICEWIVLTCKP